MPNQTKIESDVVNLMIYNETEGLDLITIFNNFKSSIKNIYKTSIVKDLEINNRIKELET